MSNIGEMIRLATRADYPCDRLAKIGTHISTGPEFSDSVDLVEMAFDKTVPQGSLFAYLFRRFGHPNMGSDNYKELCRYGLTTEHPEMIMVICPYAGGDTNLSFTFHVPPEISSACAEFPYRARDQHMADFMQWIEDEGRLPENIDELTVAAKEGGWGPRRNGAEWTTILTPIMSEAYSFKQKDDGSDPSDLVAWYNGLVEEYEAINPIPAAAWRGADWNAWDDEDPMKPFAAAIHETLQDLKRPVYVRDVAIDPWGQCDDPYDGDLQSVDHSDAAGYPSGNLGNVDPDGFADLQTLIMRLSPDNHAEAIKIASGILSKELDGPSAAETETSK